jgi:hypothetical protein
MFPTTEATKVNERGFDVTRRFAVVLSFLTALALPAAVLAHEGHAHKIMGTVTQVHADAVSHVEVKTTDGKTVVLKVDDQTKFTKGKAPATLKDVQVGARVVATVTMEGNTTTASEIVLGEGRAAPEPQQHQH